MKQILKENEWRPRLNSQSKRVRRHGIYVAVRCSDTKQAQEIENMLNKLVRYKALGDAVHGTDI